MALVSTSSAASCLVEPETSLQDAITAFRNILTSDQRAELSSITSVPSADAVLVFTAELDRKRHQDGKLGRSIASRLSKVMRCVRDFSSIIDMFVSSHPDIAALVWGTVKLTMHIVINFASYYEAVAEFFMHVGQRSPLFEEYQALFLGSDGLQKALCDYHAAIIRCCSHIVVVLRRSTGKRLLRAVRESFSQEFEQDMQDIGMRGDHVEEQIKLASAQAIIRNQELLRLEARKRDKSDKVLALFHQETKAKLDNIKDMQLGAKEQAARSRKQALLETLSDHDYHEPFSRERKKRYNHTASWLFFTPEFERWMKSTGSAFFSCSGKMGSGKTILATSVIDYIFTHKSPISDSAAFFFARFDQQESLQADTILRSIARQLIDRDKMSEEFTALLEEIKSNASIGMEHVVKLILEIIHSRKVIYIVLDGLDACPPGNRRQLYQALAYLASSHPSIKIFVSSRLAVPQKINSSFSVVESISMGCQSAQTDIRDIVNEAVEAEIEEERLFVGDQNLVEDIKRKLAMHANGMLLWVTLQLREICAQRCDKDIRDTISDERLPKDLAGAFNQVLARIQRGSNETITQRLLPWIIAAKRPLSLIELEECGFIEVLQTHSMEDRRVNGIQRIESWFEGLIEVDEEQKTVHLIHNSVRQFLLSRSTHPEFEKFHFGEQEVDHYLGEMCVTFLNFTNLERTVAERPKQANTSIPLEEVLQRVKGTQEFGLYWKNLASIHRMERSARVKHISIPVKDDGIPANTTFWSSSAATAARAIEPTHPFVKYAAMHWFTHTTSFQELKSKTWQLWKKMVLHGHRLAWLPITDWVHDSFEENLIFCGMKARHLGILDLISPSSELRTHGESMLQRFTREHDKEMLEYLLLHKRWGSKIYESFSFSVKDGYSETTKMFVDYGIDVNVVPRELDSWTALQFSVHEAEENLKMVQVLIEGGASVDAAPRLRSTPLQLATTKHRHHTMRLLLRFGADVNFVAGNTTALSLAISGGDLCAVEILLKAGAHVEIICAGSLRESPLQLAVEGPNPRAVQMLLDAGAKPNTLTRKGLTPLQIGFLKNRRDVVKSLLQHGADPNMPILRGLTPLQTGVKTWPEWNSDGADFVDVLLHAGANPNMSVCEGLTPLQQALCSSAKISIVLVASLLAAGADPDMPVAEGLLPLQMAAASDNIDAIQLLLDKKAKVDSFTREATPLTLSSSKGHLRAAKILVEAGAAVNGDPTQRTPLQSASSEGHSMIVDFLLKAGAAPDIDNSSKTALGEASYGHHAHIVKMLLDAGAAVDARSNGKRFGETPLQLAAQQDHYLTVEILVKGGADVNAAPSHSRGLTALQETVVCRSEDAARCLLEAGADIYQLSTRRQPATALWMAMELHYPEMVELLRRYEASPWDYRKMFTTRAMKAVEDSNDQSDDNNS